MFKKEILLGNFVKKDKILSYLEFIHNKYSIPYYNLFIYDIENNKEEYIVTFKIATEKRFYVNEIKGAILFHYKKGCLFSINALNQLIKETYPNITDTKNVEINWLEYKDKLITIVEDKVSCKKIEKIEDKNLLFK